MLSFKNVQKAYGQNRVLDGVSFSLKRGEKCGLVGSNGTGKSTILKIAAGLLASDSGSVESTRGTSIAYLGQELTGEEEKLTVRELASPANGIFPERAAKALCGRLGLENDFLERRVSGLSGGEKTKAALVRILAGRHGLYLLDEPTNNLDPAGLALLERVIAASPSAFLIVSHDRKLLDRVTSKTLELDEFTRTVRTYGGAFSEYLREREARIAAEWSEYGDYKQEAARLDDAARRKKNWAKEGNDSRNEKDNDKFIAGKARDYAKGNAAAAKSIEKRRERLEEISKPQERLPLKLSFNEAGRGSDVMFSCSGISVSLGGRVFGPLDLEIGWGERIALVGPNGAGKSTLAKILAGEIPPDAGIIRRGQGMTLGYLPQEGLSGDRTALEVLAEASSDEEGMLRRTLHRFRIDAADVSKPISALSPGQRSRLILAKLMLGRANCLILDEPTNHLDLEALEALEGALRSFHGTVVVITHDRYFLDRLEASRTYFCGPGWGLRQINGYSELESEAEREIDAQE